MKKTSPAIRPHREMKERKPSQYAGVDHGESAAKLDQGYERFSIGKPKPDRRLLNGGKK